MNVYRVLEWITEAKILKFSIILQIIIWMKGKSLEINTLLKSSMDRKYAVDILFSFNSDSPTPYTFYISLFIVEYRAISVTKLQTNLLRKLTYNTWLNTVIFDTCRRWICGSCVPTIIYVPHDPWWLAMLSFHNLRPLLSFWGFPAEVSYPKTLRRLHRYRRLPADLFPRICPRTGRSVRDFPKAPLLAYGLLAEDLLLIFLGLRHVTFDLLYLKWYFYHFTHGAKSGPYNSSSSPFASWREGTCQKWAWI